MTTEQKRELAKQFLGRRWLLHPANRVQKKQPPRHESPRGWTANECRNHA